ncbi:MAG TPA: DUF4251 domain-containing protein [Candidatus Egerieousia sp.]|jgi:hypothetical protein|nr:DUF4251 domain-containing protein [Candidatus Egerieousia sp.]HPT06322.1 DUF4251 domain-containing protein [Candidatus Egerieousia sp.]
MKKSAVILALIFLPVLCSGQTKNSVASFEPLFVRIEQVIPLNIAAKNTISDGYFLQIENDTLTCYMPYFGNSRTAMLGRTGNGVKADKQKIKIDMKYNAKKMVYDVWFNFKNEDIGEAVACSIKIYDNGLVHIGIESNYRDFISYDGQRVEKLQRKK